MIRNEKSRRCTLQDIADRTGYTVNTVSRALKNKSDISAATREYIRQAADEMGYIRNQMASSLRSGQTKTLGVIVGGMSNPYYGVMTDAIQNVAAEYGYSLLIFCSRDDPELELQVVETAISRQVDGILLFPCRGSGRTIERMKAAGVPYVLMARHLDSPEDDWVVCGEEEGAYLAAKHLIDAGHTRLGFLSSFDNIQSILPVPAPLCSVGYDIPAMARSGIDLLRKRIHREDMPAQHITFRPTVVCRGSCSAKAHPRFPERIPDIYRYCR